LDHLTFTVKSKIAVQTNMTIWATRFTEFLHAIRVVLAVPNVGVTTRAVFDVNVPSPGVLTGYPIVVDLNWAGEIFAITEPTVRVLQFLAVFAALSIPDGVFPPFVHGLLGLLAAYSAVIKKWPRVVAITPPHLEGNLLWRCLLELLTNTGMDPFAGAMHKVRTKVALGPTAPADVADMFVGALAQKAKRSAEEFLAPMQAAVASPLSARDAIFGTNNNNRT
jgi:hypothetical protein